MSDGHRKRLRERFLQSGLDGFLDYEIIELLLTLGTPRKDCKQQAKQIINTYGTLKHALDADPKDMQKIPGIGPNNIFGLRLFSALWMRYTHEEIPDMLSFDTIEKLAQYLQKRIGREKVEHVVLICLNARRQMVDISDISMGILDGALVHPREIFAHAISSRAAMIILGHNHPSGDPTPSSEDVRMTHQLIHVSQIVDIPLYDHVIVTRDGYVSMKEEGLMS